MGSYNGWPDIDAQASGRARRCSSEWWWRQGDSDIVSAKKSFSLDVLGTPGKQLPILVRTVPAPLGLDAVMILLALASAVAGAKHVEGQTHQGIGS